MDKLKLAKVIVGFLTSASVGAVVENAITFTTPPGIKIYNKILVVIGKAVISGIVATAAERYVSKEIDDVFGVVEAAKSAVIDVTPK